MKLFFEKNKQPVNLILIDIVSVFASLVFAFLLGEGRDLSIFSLDFVLLFIFNLAVVFASLSFTKLYRYAYKMAGLHEAIRVGLGVSLILFIDVIVTAATSQRFIGFKQLAVYCVILAAFIGLSRFSSRIYDAFKFYLNKGSSEIRKVVIIGAGEAGNQISRELQTTSKINYLPVAFIDDNPQKIGEFINGIKVVGTTKDLVWICRKFEADEILIAIPSAKKQVIRGIMEVATPTGLPIKKLPGIYQLISGEATITSIKPVDVTDLLGREEVKVNIDEIIKYIKDEVVMVTGGGGSIGSELCRQIATHSPKQLIIFDIYENNVYDIEQELKRKNPNLNLLTLIGSIRDSSKLRNVFEKYHPTIIFNAAAHKHVPLMETSPNEAIKNNAIGTLKLAKLADEFKTKTFVQISTDKAVNPTNIMGASKRICEMIIQTIGRHSKYTNFVAVRFGNVLGSNGSVIPLFKKQIEEGGPITLTHRDITRYFMTIPEAVSLVLEAGAYAKKGQIFVLDMGEPVKIYDLAVNLIKLSGLKPGVDIEIKEVGLRPGEKLYEERLMDEEGLEKTANGLISVAKPIKIDDEEKFFKDIDTLYELAYKETDEMKGLVAKLVPTYKVDRR